ncbi:zinc transporter ZIP13-like [Dendronephthya gigantea]|uniref:zinc transporter ZIP13-like n=1 Tax=Dendronephthya gigantea TaxID=151771 RepID=UPI00106CB196|nr:zinc transporter ZIP13-like [Dendronephthya gigantea]
MAFIKRLACAITIGLLIAFHLRIVESAGKIHRAVPRPASYSNGAFNEEISRDLSSDYNPWFYAIIGTLLVGLTGIFPLLVFPVEEGHKLREGVSADKLKLLLSFAVGGLLGDVFLHLLPEAYGPATAAHDDYMRIGLWVLGGILTFLILEKIFMDEESEAETTQCNGLSNGACHEPSLETENACNGSSHVGNGYSKHKEDSNVRKRNKESENKNSDETKECSQKDSHVPSKEKEIKVVGYLNLLANCIDNFTHGLAVSGSFLVSRKVGLLTTFAILLHEIPHEIGDFAILLKAGFRRWDAARGQIVTATGGMVGAIFGLVFTEAGDSASWVLPFTSGGFIYIALVTIVPELLEEKRPWESMKQVVCLVAGIASMGLVSLIH